MPKISKYQAEQIAYRAVTDSFEKEAAELIEHENFLALECYECRFPEEERAAAREFKHPQWLHHRESLFVSSARGLQSFLKLSKALPFPDNQENQRQQLSGDLSDRVDKLLVQKTDLSTRRESAKRRLIATIRGCSTFNKLLQLWPEGQKFYASCMKREDPVPAQALVSFKAINQALGLSKEELVQ